MGAAMAAGIGAGVYGGYADAAAKLVHVSKKVMPRAEYKEIYEKKYKTYRQMIDALSGVWENLREGGEGDV